MYVHATADSRNVRRHDTRSHKRNAKRGGKPFKMAILLMAGDRRICGLSAKKRYMPRSPNPSAGMIEMLPVATGASPKKSRHPSQPRRR
ncbi:protein of unknown function (plasmid) [Shinella sp. WSC3-e]|nr:protein of unknown function [Shinella sp. WSC3-e]